MWNLRALEYKKSKSKVQPSDPDSDIKNQLSNNGIFCPLCGYTVSEYISQNSVEFSSEGYFMNVNVSCSSCRNIYSATLNMG